MLDAIVAVVALSVGLGAGFLAWGRAAAANARRCADVETAKAVAESRVTELGPLKEELQRLQAEHGQTLNAAGSDKAALLAAQNRVQELAHELDATRGERDRLNSEVRDKTALLATASTARNAAESAGVEAAERHAREIASVRAEARREAEERLADKDLELQKRDAFIERLEEKLREILGKTAGEVVQRAQEDFLKISKQTAEADLEKRQKGIDDLVGPLRQQLEELERIQERYEKERAGEAAVLKDGIARLATQTSVLENALRKPQIRGAWGEQQLQILLENAGMVKDRDFTIQESTTEEDERLRADFVIALPHGRKLVIDCKTPFDAYIEAMSAQDELMRSQGLGRHVDAVRGHIRELSSKRYQDRHPGADCVILFIPHEGAYIHALEREPKLVDEGRERRVYIASPSSILGIVHMARYILAEGRARDSADLMRKECGDLVERVRVLAGHLTSLGNSLGSTVSHYNRAVSSVDGRLMVTTRNLQKLDVAPSLDQRAPDAVQELPTGIRSPELLERSLETPPLALE